MQQAASPLRGKVSQKRHSALCHRSGRGSPEPISMQFLDSAIASFGLQTEDGLWLPAGGAYFWAVFNIGQSVGVRDRPGPAFFSSWLTAARS